MDICPLATAETAALEQPVDVIETTAQQPAGGIPGWALLAALGYFAYRQGWLDGVL